MYWVITLSQDILILTLKSVLTEQRRRIQDQSKGKTMTLTLTSLSSVQQASSEMIVSWSFGLPWEKKP